MHPQLQAAIEEMYAAFARPAPRAVDGCTVCCFTEEELRALAETPLRQLGEKQLGSYASSALLTVGDVDDLRYFWPRMVELAARGELWTDLEIVFDKPRRGEWRSWPRREQEAIEGFVRAQMAELARRELDDDEVDRWVCAFGVLMEGEDVVPCLAPLLEATPASRANLFSLYSWNARKVARGDLSNPFWDSAPGNEARVAAWLRGAAAGEALARYHPAHPAGS
jgi:hypothetical protein